MACVYMSCIMHKVSKYMCLNACFVVGNYKRVFFNLDWSFNEKLLCVYVVICFVLIIRALLSHVVMISLFFFLIFQSNQQLLCPSHQHILTPSHSLHFTSSGGADSTYSHCDTHYSIIHSWSAYAPI